MWKIGFPLRMYVSLMFESYGWIFLVCSRGEAMKNFPALQPPCFCSPRKEYIPWVKSKYSKSAPFSRPFSQFIFLSDNDELREKISEEATFFIIFFNWLTRWSLNKLPSFNSLETVFSILVHRPFSDLWTHLMYKSFRWLSYPI